MLTLADKGGRGVQANAAITKKMLKNGGGERFY